MLINPCTLQYKYVPREITCRSYIVVYIWRISKSLHTSGHRNAVVPKVFKFLTLLTI